MAPPAPTNIYVSDNGDNIKSADKIHHRDNLPDEVDDHSDDGESGKTDNLGDVVLAFEAHGVKNLSDEKNEDASLGSVIDGEDNVGTESD